MLKLNKKGYEALARYSLLEVFFFFFFLILYILVPKHLAQINKDIARYSSKRIQAHSPSHNPRPVLNKPKEN